MSRDSRNGFSLPFLALLMRRQNWPLLSHLDRFEAIFRRATAPLMIVFFLLVAVAAIVNIQQTHNDMVERARTRINLAADALATSISRGAGSLDETAFRQAQAIINGSRAEQIQGYAIAITRAGGQIIATNNDMLPAMNNLAVLLGDAMPRGASRTRWNVLMIVATTVATFGSIWALKDQALGSLPLGKIGIGGLAALFVLGLLGFLAKEKKSHS